MTILGARLWGCPSAIPIARGSNVYSKEKERVPQLIRSF
jgi:hypothetical protein